MLSKSLIQVSVDGWGFVPSLLFDLRPNYVEVMKIMETSFRRRSHAHKGWMKHKLKSRLQEEIPVTSDMQMIPPLWQKAKKN